MLKALHNLKICLLFIEGGILILVVGQHDCSLIGQPFTTSVDLPVMFQPQAQIVIYMQVHFGLNYISYFSSNFGRSVIIKTWKPGRLPSSCSLTSLGLQTLQDRVTLNLGHLWQCDICSICRLTPLHLSLQNTSLLIKKQLCLFFFTFLVSFLCNADCVTRTSIDLERRDPLPQVTSVDLSIPHPLYLPRRRCTTSSKPKLIHKVIRVRSSGNVKQKDLDSFIRS
ncbi:hypothetical protein NC651_039810 [Populus alba x Populus x berolinensis]|nr:hypothetical protein NC651_039810 [Populus alba x Populus x berolinensis]